MPNVVVLVGAGFKSVCDMFKSEGWTITNDMNEADLVQFTGGSDVSPTLYGHNIHKTTRNDLARDEREKEVFVQCLDMGIPMAGICRGGQFLNVMNGGKMFQDVDGHAQGNHKAWLRDAILPVTVTSTHHQMMDPNYSTEVEILLTAGEATRRWSMSDEKSSLKYETVLYPDKNKPTDVEACYYPGTRSLCFQPHPEFIGHTVADTKDIYFMLLEDYLLNGNERMEQLQA